MPDFTTGFSVLEDIGILAYNGVIFSSLYTSRINGRVVPDAANRTTKLQQYDLEVQAVVTLGTGDKTTDGTWEELREKLTQHGGYLTCEGKGFGPLNVNPPVGGIGNPNISTTRDVAWGPVPTLIAFQPLGASRSAFIHWACTTRVVESFHPERVLGTGATFSVLQFNWDYNLRFDAQGYASYSITGTLEIPLTRNTVDDRAVRQTVDDFRSFWMDMQTDLLNFRVTERDFRYSRDKRTCEWVYAVEELPAMGIPPGCTEARGTMSVRNSGGLRGGSSTSKIMQLMWTVSLRATYTVRGDYDQRVAAYAFYALLWYRLQQTRNARLPLLNNRGNAPQQDGGNPPLPQVGDPPPGIKTGDIAWWNDRFGRNVPEQREPPKLVFLTDFGFDEGLYLDGKTITFHASWWFTGTFASIFRATGVWHWLEDTTGGNMWAASVDDIMGASSWLFNRLDKTQDVIVDFNGGAPPIKAPPAGGR